MRGKDSVMAHRRRGLFARFGHALLERVFLVANRFVQWYEWPVEILKEMNLLALRNLLRARNLHDASVRRLQGLPDVPARDMRHLYSREWDGDHNDLTDPAMGRKGERFGRNTPFDRIRPPDGDLFDPNPRTVSDALLVRDQFKPATTLNLLAAAWIQFQVHDWFAHDTPAGEDELELPQDRGGPPHPIRVPRTKEDLPRLAGSPPAFANQNSHWWDGSQVYGDDEITTTSLRSHPDGSPVPEGKLALDDGGLLRLVPDPDRPDHVRPLTGFQANWWTGLELLHTLFTHEHNAICDALRHEYPLWSDDQLFYTARLVNAALMAKIHTVEWTTAILATKALERAMNTNWSGMKKETLGDRISRFLLSLLGEDELLDGILHTSADHHTAPYALTEEFVAVYRMHPLIPDEFEFRLLTGAGSIPRMGLMDVAFDNARKPLQAGATMADLFYSFGLGHPGAITLRNFPRSLTDVTLPNGRRIDLAAVDILRDRERGVPRYNAFRRMLHMPPVRSFASMSQGDAAIEKELRRIYGDVDRVDTMVGLFSERPPDGFGFSDTAFRVFILMASRRLKSDRFFTDDYRPEIYTPLGLEWVESNTLGTVLVRHYPALKSVLRLDNAFKPWHARSA